MRSTTLLALVAAVLFIFSGCGEERCAECEAGSTSRAAAIQQAAAHDHGAAKDMECKMPPSLVASLKPTKGNSAAGTVRFTTVEGGVRVVADLTGLTPNAKHAIHLHEFGDASAEDGSSAGGHYNPGGHPHGAPEAEQHHAGDLGNLTADASGNAHYEIVAKGLTLCCGPAPVIGRSVIVHAKEDDLTSQPAGNAGPRIAQGVIGIGK